MDDPARPNPASGQASSADAGLLSGPGSLADPRAISILTTEHFGLQTARSLVYNEAFARSGMFLTFVSATLVALGFVAQGKAFGPAVPLVGGVLLAVDLFLGVATLGRIVSATTEEIAALQGMARLRHAYVELVPGVEPYLSTAYHDDFASVMSAYGSRAGGARSAQSAVHGLTTAGGMVSVIDSVIAGALVGVVAAGLGADLTFAALMGLGAGIVMMGVLVGATIRAFAAQERNLEVRFRPTLPAA